MALLERPVSVHGSSATPSDGGQPFSTRLFITVAGVVGAATAAYGVTQPWLSTFAGLLSQSGWGTSNGNILLALASTAAVVAVLQAGRASMLLRWILSLTGLAITGFTGYLLIQLYGLTAQLDGMVLPSKGPGLYVAAIGGVLVFATIFLPLPRAETAKVPRTTASHATATPSIFRPLGSGLRYPAAALAVIAGLAHVPVTPEHLQEAPYIGVLFMVLTVTCVLTATMLLISDIPAAWLLLGSTCILAIVAYVASRTVGLPLMADDVNNWYEPLGLLSIGTEFSAAVLVALALVRSRRRDVTATEYGGAR